MKIFLGLCAARYPEVGGMSWAVYFGRPRKFIFRLIAFATSGVYPLMQLGWFYFSTQDNSFGAGLISGFIAHIIWWPFVLVGGAVSFFVLRTIPNRNRLAATSPEIQQESQ